MNIQTEKLDLIEWIARLKDSSVIERLLQIREDYSKEEEMLSKAELDSIEKGLNDFKEGRVHSHEAVKKLYEKYI